MFSFRNAGVVAAVFLLCLGHAVARSSPLVRVLPNRITPKYLVADALHRTYRQELNGNGQRPAVVNRPGQRRMPMHRARLLSPIALAETMTTFRSPRGQIAAYKVVTLGSTSIHGTHITSLYSYFYNPRTGALLQYSAAPASAALARAHGFPVNPF